MDLDLRDKRVLITGSSSGIGLGIARAFLSEGTKAFLTGRRHEILASAMQDLCESFGADRVLCAAGDLTQSAAILEILKTIEKQWRGLDVLVLNLGSGRTRFDIDIDIAEWDRVLHLNLTSAMDTLNRARLLLRSGDNPSVVFVGSIAGLEDVGAPVAYSAAKAALTQAMKATARMLAADGVRVNMVAPGNIYFKGGTWDRKITENAQHVHQMLESQVPLKRFGTVEEVAAAVLFLASRCASFITGACITVDGGQTHTI